MIDVLFLDIINEKENIRNCDTDSLRKGIHQYINDNGLTELEKHTQDETVLKEMLRIYLEPIVSEAENGLCDYFIHYEELHEFKLLSNKSLKFAIAKYEGKQIDADEYNSLKDHVEKLVWSLYAVPLFKPYIERLYSETLINLKYAEGQTDSLSNSLRDYIK